ncbi:TonB-dependent receptor plug domain-containing protein, partial [Acinetobacter baumannii]
MNIPPRPFKLSVIACAICYANLTYAQDAQVQALQTIQVKASNAEQSSEQTKAYNVKNSSSATKLNIEAKETPQTINVVTRQQIEDFGLTSTRDVLRNTPGVTVS